MQSRDLGDPPNLIHDTLVNPIRLVFYDGETCDALHSAREVLAKTFLARGDILVRVEGERKVSPSRSLKNDLSSTRRFGCEVTLGEQWACDVDVCPQPSAVESHVMPATTHKDQVPWTKRRLLRVPQREESEYGGERFDGEVVDVVIRSEDGEHVHELDDRLDNLTFGMSNIISRDMGSPTFIILSGSMQSSSSSSS